MDIGKHLGTIIMVVIVCLPILIVLARKAISRENIVIRDLLPLLIEAIKNLNMLQTSKRTSYNVFEGDAVYLLHQYVQSSELFYVYEKEILTQDTIRILIRPYLKKMYKK